MIGKQILMAITGLSAGIVVACGLYSFIVGLKVLSHMASITSTEQNLLLYESSIMSGGILGNLIWIFRPHFKIGGFTPAVFGLCAGIFVGCWSMSILEVLRGFPIFVRKTGLLAMIQWLVLILATGKMAGSFIFFYLQW